MAGSATACARRPWRRRRQAGRESRGCQHCPLTAIDTRIVEINKRLAVEFPDYAALALPQPLTVEQVQADLRADEALVLFLDTPESQSTDQETFIWVVTKTDMRWVRSELGTTALTREVAALRCGLDLRAWDGAGATRCAVLLMLLSDVGTQSTKRIALPFRPRARAVQLAVRPSRGFDRGQASAAGAVRPADAASVSSVGDASARLRCPPLQCVARPQPCRDCVAGRILAQGVAPDRQVERRDNSDDRFR